MSDPTIPPAPSFTPNPPVIWQCDSRRCLRVFLSPPTNGHCPFCLNAVCKFTWNGSRWLDEDGIDSHGNGLYVRDAGAPRRS